MKLMMTGRPGKAPIGELSFIDDAGHWVQQENPTKVLEVVEKFLKAVNEL
jgi:pimeloyl-ACP methyl ester carboxylesterase